ncbi:MAG: hypothetical protein QW382_00505 [Nitrososphaerota archaeon]
MKNFRILVLLLVFLGFISTSVAQQVITTTTTTILTVPGKTYVTTLTGGESTITMIVPEYTMIIVEKRLDKTCTLVIKPLESSGVVAIPGTTITVPGTTIQTVITEPTIKYATTINKDGILTTTGYTYIEYVTTMYGQTISVPLPIYAEIIQRCGTIQVVEEVTIIMGKVPATFYYAYPGITYSFEGTTYTVKDTLGEAILTPITTVEIMFGTTYTERTVFPGATETTVIVLPSTIATMTEPGRIVTSTITYVTTVKTTEQTTPTTTLITTSPTPTTKTETVKTVEELGLPFDIIIIVVVIAIISIVTAVIILLRKK